MRLPLSWLFEYLDVEQTPEGLAERLTALGIEVEGIIYENPSFSGVVVGRVESVQPHPNADKLCVARVFDGKETFQVVCGAPNCRSGILVALARVGARLGMSEDGSSAMEIKGATLRGVESAGMLCGEDELGLGDDSLGILELTSKYNLGDDLAEAFKDVVFDLALTPNLGHCLSVEGIARDLAASLGVRFVQPYHLEEMVKKADGWKVSIKEREDCPSYAALAIRNEKKSARAPLEMRVRLQRAGIRSVNAAVDCANYVMMSTGQPMHTFDSQAFPGKQIEIAHAQGSERLQVIDGRTVELSKGMLIISNGSLPVAIAGVMGSEASSVTENTKDILVESAYFNPQAVRRSGKASQTFSESLRRFERGIDPNGFEKALQLFWYLFSLICPESVIEGYVVEGRKNVKPKELTCRRSRAQSLLGVEVPRQSMELVFARLGYPATWTEAETLMVSVPAYRHDINEEVDLIEEIGKFTGLMTYTGRKIEKVSFSQLSDHPLFSYEQTTRKALISLSLQECVTCDLISPELVSLVEEQPVPKHAIISVTNPMSIEQSVLRPSLFPGLVASLRRNIAYGQRSVAFFEVGTVYMRSEGKFTERLVAGILLSGKHTPHHFSEEKERDVNFFDLKGIMESFLRLIGTNGVSVRPSSLGLFHDGRQALVACGGHQVGVLGEIHPNVMASLDIQQRIYFIEIDVQDLFQHVEKRVLMKPLANFPSMERDWTMTVPQSLSFQELIDTVQKYLPSLVESVEMRSLFAHERIGHEKKNVTLRFVFRDSARTLSQQEVESAFSQLVEQVSQSLGI